MDEIKTLLFHYLRDELTGAEQQALQTWLAASADNQALFDELNDPDRLAVSFVKMDEWQKGGGLERIRDYAAAGKTQSIGRRSSLRWVWTAAAAILLLIAGGYWLLRQPPAGKAVTLALASDIAAPAGTHAVLRLAGGRQILLDSAAEGTLTTVGAMKVVKGAGGAITYIPAGQGKTQATEAELNTLLNPRGSQVLALTLGDGTRVWLNAESSLTYPAVFTGPERSVAVTGEAYFEVAKETNNPFIVTGNGVATEVLGTRFNVNAYGDEDAVRITLLDGAVRVRKGPLSDLLQPGQQARVEDRIRVTKDIDLDQVMAWKNGFFKMKNTDIRTIMRQLTRWYDVEVVYEGAVPTGTFSGKVPRKLNLSEVLAIYGYSGVHFSIEGRKILVKP